MRAKTHWEQVYTSKAPDAVSWYEPRPETSLRLIAATGLPVTAGLIDVGAGASRLVDELLAQGFCDLTLLDISAEALALTRRRLGPRAEAVSWIEGDITAVELPERRYELWHDRAVLHFLTEAPAREQYLRRLRHALKPGGYLILGAFAEDGPRQCSGLPIVQYSPETLQSLFGPDFSLISHERKAHPTPSGTLQNFQWCLFRRRQEQA